MVVDASIVVAVFFNERHGPWAADQLRQNARRLRMSTVNFAEALILIQDRQPQLFGEIQEAILSSPIRLVPPSPEQAKMAAWARLRFPLNLGGCFAYALAKDEDCPLLTLDRDFRRTDVTVIHPGLSQLRVVRASLHCGPKGLQKARPVNGHPGGALLHTSTIDVELNGEPTDGTNGSWTYWSTVPAFLSRQGKSSERRIKGQPHARNHRHFTR